MPAAPPKAPTAGPASEALSHSDVEKVLAMVGGGDTVSAEVDAPNGGAAAGPMQVSHHDFPQLSSFSTAQMRQLRLRCEAFTAALGARLSGHLRLECSLQLTKLEAVRYHQFTASLPAPTHLTVFKLEPLPGVCLMNIPCRMALSIVDREMGGPAACQEEPRDLTQIEAKLAGKVVGILLGEWAATWADTLALKPAILRNETSSGFLRTSPPETLMLSMVLETKIAETIDQIQFAFPQSLLDPLVQKLSADLQNVEKTSAAQPAAKPEWNHAFDDVPVEMTARWHAMDLSAREIAALKIGDVVPLRQDEACQVELCLDSSPKFAGVLGTSGRKLAIKIAGAL